MMHNYVCYYENVSDIPKKVSDALCRGVTGDAFSKRELFTDDEDVIYSFRRCIGINGVNLGAEESDLIDRGLILELEPIPKDKRRKLQDIWREFEEIRPKLLGYIFDTLSKVLKVVSNGGIASEMKSYPRFADFAEIGEIISRCMNYRDGEFTKAYDDNINLQSEETINAHVVGNVTKQFVDDRQGQLWEGTWTELLEELKAVADNLHINTTYQNRSWPKAPNSLSRRINEVRPNLRELGIVIEKGFTDQTKRSKDVKIWRISSEPSEPSDGSSAGQNHAQISSDISSYMSDDIIKNVDDIPSDNMDISSEDNTENHAQIASDTKGSDDTDDTDDIFQGSQDPVDTLKGSTNRQLSPSSEDDMTLDKDDEDVVDRSQTVSQPSPSLSSIRGDTEAEAKQSTADPTNSRPGPEPRPEPIIIVKAEVAEADNEVAAAASKPIVSVEEFFYDNPVTPWEPLPVHTLEQSPCCPVLGSKVEHGRVWYYCKLHPKDRPLIDLSSVEQHCKFKDPELHRAEIVRLTSPTTTADASTAEDNV
jgi:hypothetical protein